MEVVHSARGRLPSPREVQVKLSVTCPQCRAKLETLANVASSGPIYDGGPEGHSVNCPSCDATYIVKGFKSLRPDSKAADWRIRFCPFCGEEDPGVARPRPKERIL